MRHILKARNFGSAKLITGNFVLFLSSRSEYVSDKINKKCRKKVAHPGKSNQAQTSRIILQMSKQQKPSYQGKALNVPTVLQHV